MIQTIKISDTGLQYQDRGAGKVILLLHGGGGPEPMEPLIAKLESSHRVIVPVMPGFDGEPEPGWMERPYDIAYFYLEFIRELGLQDIAIVGHSLGGWIAAEMAIRQDSALTRLCLISSAGIHVKGVKKGDNFLWSSEQTIRNFFVNNDLIESAIARMQEDPEPLRAIQRQRIVAKLVWRPRWYEPQLQRWLSRIRIPAQIIWGDSDHLFPQEYGRAYASAINGAELSVIEQCGHIPYLEKQDEFLTILNKFLQGGIR